MKVAAALSVLSLISLAGARGQAQQPRRVLPEGAEETQEPEIEPPYAGAPRGGAPYTEGNIDYDVTYDDSVAQSYDDGYDPQAYQQFEETLSPHGAWVDDDTYGRVWQPSPNEVGDDFSPYDTGGRWAMTEYGWTWNSDWDWGWAPFHYGRWTTLASLGWCWLPGTLWGPAWVSWRAGGGYVGWAPLPPRHVTIGSPLGVRSAWRFALADDMGHGRAPTLPARIVPRIFGRMTVVSNPRALPIPGARVRVNAGPILAGMPSGGGSSSSSAPRLATIAPRAIPRRAIDPHLGTPAEVRPWIRGGSAPMAQRPYGQRATNLDARGRAMPSAGLPVGAAPARAFNPSALPVNRRGAMIHAAPTTAFRGQPYTAPSFRAPVYRAPPAMAPRPAAAPVHFSAPTFSSPGYGGGGGRSLGGGGGGGRSLGGGGGSRPLGGGGRSLGGGRR